MTCAPTNHHRFAVQLDREWSHLRRSRRALERARAWESPSGSEPLDVLLIDLDDLDLLLDATNADVPLVRLVQLAQHDALAGRVVIQRILPGLVSRSARYRSRRDDVDPLEIAVAAAWIAIRRYDVTARRHHVAACLISDATFDAFRRPLRRKSASEAIVPTEVFARRAAPAEQPTALEQLAEVVRAARLGGVSDDDIGLIRELVQVGSPSILADRLGVTSRTIRNRRNRAVAHIREIVAA